MDVKTKFPFPLTRAGIVDQSGQKIQEFFARWESKLCEQPSSFVQAEVEALALSGQMAGYLLAGLLNSAHVREAVSREAEEVRKRGGFRIGYLDTREVEFLCGLKLRLGCMYCGPKKSVGKTGGKKGAGKRGKEGAGLCPELAVLGIEKGKSFGVQSEVSRLGVLLPSYELADQELRRRHLQLDSNKVRAIIILVCEQALAARREELEAWRSGQLKAGNLFQGAKVVVSVDGGRTRTRKTKGGRRNRNNRHGYHTPWCEPKLLILYAVDKEGRMDRNYPCIIDGTFLGPDHLMELAAYHLFRTGAREAAHVAFLGDGAEWIWDRVPRVVEVAGLPAHKWSAAVDLYHVMEHVGKALEKDGRMSLKERKGLRKQLKAWLVQGKLAKVIDRLEELLSGDDSQVKDSGQPEVEDMVGSISSAIEREEENCPVSAAVRYLRKYGRLMPYRQHRKAGLPIGTGAIESAIRRVINQRLKNPSSFWLIEHAEGVLYLRAQLLSNNWDALMEKLHARRMRSRRRDWNWTATPFSFSSHPHLQSLVSKEVRGTAA
jgi:hypothetical protein